ncbi:MAG TPA: hypothetical protein VK533_01610 [Sphingomonas sp.]|uniref:hypothetical protein n=1 Tax=Sphingomonas sp. TaxID=28214 RepID=UPI002C9108F3|nr:hypothetical protein [Sphingomonas sp.]HMI18219.1 hypothetical protein [Sphingomonas sp.]
MSHHLRILGIAVVLAIPASAQAGDWQLQPPTSDRSAVLTFGAGDPVSYKFECTPTELIVTETGVTKLIDLKTGKPIGDDAQAVMPEGAAVMALFGGKGDPQFRPAEARKNPAVGWDLTMRLAKDDKQIKAVSKGEMMSLFTTGYTMAVAMNSQSRAKWKEFMQRCQIAT